MNSKAVKLLCTGLILIVAFVIWTILVLTVDVKPIGVNETDIGFATLNMWFHSLTGVNMTLYNITDWLGLIAIFACIFFGILGFVQFIKRKSLFKVDFSLIVLGGYYIIVILCYLIFEMIPINYRPVLINGFMEVSYPSSTTLLVLSVMPTVNFQVKIRLTNMTVKRIICFGSILFSTCMIAGRLISGVHWFTDIVGSVILSTGLFLSYKAIVTIKKV